MNLLTKTFGATGKVTLDMNALGLHLVVSDSEKLNTTSVDETLDLGGVIDAVIGMVGAPAWLVGVGGFIKTELQSIAAAMTPAMKSAKK